MTTLPTVLRPGSPPRRGARWTVEEDARLLRRLRDLEAEGDPRPLATVARELGRGVGAVGTRLRAVRVGVDVALHLGAGRRGRPETRAGDA